MSDRMIRTIAIMILAMIGGFVVCDAVFDDEDEPGDLGAPAWIFDNRDDNRNGDCRHAGDNCSDDDQMHVLVCIQPDSCRFG